MLDAKRGRLFLADVTTPLVDDCQTISVGILAEPNRRLPLDDALQHAGKIRFSRLGRVSKRPIRRGAEERLIPILMTALAAGLALVPLALSAGQPGSEIQAPMAVVILCGLISSTGLNMLVVPALYLRFGAIRDEIDSGQILRRRSTDSFNEA